MQQQNCWCRCRRYCKSVRGPAAKAEVFSEARSSAQWFAFEPQGRPWTRRRGGGPVHIPRWALPPHSISPKIFFSEIAHSCFQVASAAAAGVGGLSIYPGGPCHLHSISPKIFFSEIAHSCFQVASAAKVSGSKKCCWKKFTSRYREMMARPNGFEPLTPRFVVWCSIQLSYGR